jgi:hypothetical protein
MNADFVVKNSKCRLCDRQLVDESDLWAGRCNNDGACSRRQATRGVPQDVHEGGWQWRPTDKDTAFAPPFGTIRVCIDCGCLVAGGPTRCGRCAHEVQGGEIQLQAEERKP